MDMWNWLQECYSGGCLTLEELEKVLTDDKAADALWRDFAADTVDFRHYVRDEVWPFIVHLKKQAKDSQSNKSN